MYVYSLGRRIFSNPVIKPLVSRERVAPSNHVEPSSGFIWLRITVTGNALQMPITKDGICDPRRVRSGTSKPCHNNKIQIEKDQKDDKIVKRDSKEGDRKEKVPLNEPTISIQ